MRKLHDYLAELFVAGRLADSGWNVYFPHRDEGFDFIITKLVRGKPLIRPVQVKGKYPDEGKSDKTVYGYVGKLSLTHPEMVLAVPFFRRGSDVPTHTAFMPASSLRRHSRGFRCQPATFRSGCATPRASYRRFFDAEGIAALEHEHWSGAAISLDDEGPSLDDLDSTT